ncbi:MAG: hypothetical protein COY38_00870 [Candidatus Aenigmarchaeota archaeon CG_4_10_14_0_8_um_filter_37_24]|nr:nucleotidyltransferase domain-containing protein [Candidatus Aenigmarchaeota archaeon]OIN86193.1 MAG: hypothetical protein AUJ50_03910 [Candidatus Aenigmarchaeota archaeon CG1_02_38_14]PIV68766.1 MAG: hypothetical protein COS07_03050 [Candidatus Aenigmarchaeota archaeon CG01_land_8_20_14_3_00_37_9]PIX50461.1 MAG: hypothetical protein COZ52_04010 [Candidatus Aenigmarchaeota archaeon CG_4_8_14_3_um_filter_37_24]PIY35096.1 MAG: hypothetical protein COZ04_04595 [Candidatus Aenigmarchaeota archae
MIQNYIRYKILRIFFDYPTRKFQLREISRIIQLGLPSVINHVKNLEKQGFVKKINGGVYDSYTSDKTEIFKIYKKNDVLIRLHESGLVDLLVDTVIPDAIVLFGSASKGEDIEESDIDLFLIAKEKKVDLKIFEKKLNRKISLHFEDKIQNIPKELLNNIVNGIIIYGYLKVVE